jgi:hypothetical protein
MKNRLLYTKTLTVLLLISGFFSIYFHDYISSYIFSLCSVSIGSFFAGILVAFKHLKK